MRSILFALAPLCALLGAVGDVAVAQPLPGPTVREVVEFTHIIQPAHQNDDVLHEQVSPDGAQAFVVTRKADVASDRNRYDIQLLDLVPAHLAAQHVPAPVTVFSVAAANDNFIGTPAVQDVRWADDRTLVFLARLNDAPAQVYSLDVPERKLVQLTHEANLIVSYDVPKDHRRVVYAVQVPSPPLREGQHGIVVGSQSFWGIKFGQLGPFYQDRVYQFFVADAASRQPARALGNAFAQQNGSKPVVDVSPDGRWALLPRYEPQRLAAWRRQYPLVEESAKTYAHSQQVDPLQYFSTPISYVPRRMTAWRLDDGAEHTVVDAPDDSQPGSGQLQPDRLWQGTGSSVVLAGTFLPLAADGKSSPASHVIEFWPDSGRWTPLATLETRLDSMHALRDGFVLSDGGKRREFHRQADGGWRESASAADASTQGAAAWTLHIAQGLNEPADVVATGPAGQDTRLTRLNPQFDAHSWGTMQPYGWRDAAGRQWDGGLMSGSGTDAHARLPLLIQTYGFSPDRFYLDGQNRYDGMTSAFAGRAFLREGMRVLAMPWRATVGAPDTERASHEAFNEGVKAAVDALVKDGRVDASKVGIIGWSATGERVLKLVTFGDVPFRAATVADGDANTLFSYTLTYGIADAIWQRKEQVNEGLPVGDKLATWVRNDSALHTDCIRAALRIETYGALVLNNWDIYALLRRQYKPAEMIVLPNGTHSLQGPGDRMMSLQGNVDWYAFWLAGKERTVPLLDSETTESVAAQYARWRQMATLKAADDARPRCVR